MAGAAGGGSIGAMSAGCILRLIAVLAFGLAAAGPAGAAQLWDWSYSAAGIAASGTFTTGDAPDGDGRFAITGITGTRNGVAITGLQAAGTPIPGNEPYAVDNLVSAASPQLTVHGFGFALADGTFCNPFFADFRAPRTYLEFYSAGGVTGQQNSELPVVFTASQPQRP